MTNKLGFYLHSFEIGDHKGDLFRAIQEIRPPVMLVHAWDQVDQLRRLSPDSFIIGRMTYYGPDKRPVNDLVNTWLNSDDPEARGREFAEHILRDNFGMALRRENGRLLIDAWMSLNEAVPGPVSDQYRQNPSEIERRLRAYDAFQVGFRNKLMEHGVEAVAFNFGAGNFASADHYARFFPRTLAVYTYLGFHEYGWPALSITVDPTATSSAGSYRAIVRELSQRTGRRYEAILTEAGLALMFKYPNSMDKGWLCTPPPELGAKAVTQAAYWRSLQWLNGYLVQDDFACGACLFEVGHAGDWETFRHFGQDNAGQAIQIISHIADLAATGRTTVPRAATPTAQATHVTLRGRSEAQRHLPINGAFVRLVGGADTLGADPHAVANCRGAVTWTRALTGYGGSLWNCWQRYVGPRVAGITWEEFRAEVVQHNPVLRSSNGVLDPQRIYFLPENRIFPDTRSALPTIVWDRPLTGFSGDRWACWQQYVQGKVVSLNWETFRTSVMEENPTLTATGGYFQADQAYRLPHNEGQTEYTRVAYTEVAGSFVFADLAPGVYQLEVAANGYRRLVQPVVVTAASSIILTLEPSCVVVERGEQFVRIHGTNFVIGGRSFPFVGVNLRGLAHYGTETLQYADIHTQLVAAREVGVRVVRIFLPSSKVSFDENKNRLGRLIDVMKRDFAEMYLIVALANLYSDVDFRVPGDDHFYDLRPSGESRQLLNLAWFQDGYRQNYLPFAESILRTFSHEPTIMAYDIGNELKAQDQPELLVRFMLNVAGRLRDFDQNHLLTTGMISTRHAFLMTPGKAHLRRQIYDTPLLDFITNHAYHIDGNDKPSPEDDSDLSRELVKPLLIEEAGFAAFSDRTALYTQEIDQLFGRGAVGYMPWGFMAGANNGDGDDQLGVDGIWHGADWESLRHTLRAKADTLAQQAVNVDTTTAAFVTGQQVFAAAGVRLRQPAGLKGDIIHQMTQRALVTVLGAAQVKDDLNWWPVRVVLDDGQVAEGWMAQMAPSGEVLLSAV